MMPGGGKAKGSAFEREVCKKLSLWVSSGYHEDVFWRSAMSGGRATVARGRGKKANSGAGDLALVRPVGAGLINNYVVECKHTSGIMIHDLIECIKKTGLADYWNTIRYESEKVEKLPMLVAKATGGTAFVVLSARGWSRMFPGDLYQYRADVVFPKSGCVLIWLDRFVLEAIPPDPPKLKLMSHQ